MEHAELNGGVRVEAECMHGGNEKKRKVRKRAAVVEEGVQRNLNEGSVKV